MTQLFFLKVLVSHLKKLHNLATVLIVSVPGPIHLLFQSCIMSEL